MIYNSAALPQTPFYFIRHGETDWNRENIITGSIDMPLNTRGIQQAHEASELLLEENFDTIISSPRIRAQQTAEIIAQKTRKPVIFDQGLVERNWGEAEGTVADPTKSLFDDAHTPPGAEPFSAFQKRVIETMSSILLIKGPPLIVSHGGVFKALVYSLGYKTLGASNCTPFFFNPPLDPRHPWSVCCLGEEGI